MIQLEKYEWCDFWWGETDEHEHPRVLLVGDSITKGYRSTVSGLLKGTAYVDMLATSRAVDNPAFLFELSYITGEHSLPHDLVHFNNGLHGSHLTPEAYINGMDQAIHLLLDANPDMRLVLVTSTPVTVREDVNTLHPELNEMVIRRNEQVYALASKYTLPVNDLYTSMLEKPEFRSADGYHYNLEGQKYQADIVANLIRQELAGMR